MPHQHLKTLITPFEQFTSHKLNVLRGNVLETEVENKKCLQKEPTICRCKSKLNLKSLEIQGLCVRAQWKIEEGGIFVSTRCQCFHDH